MLEGLFHMISCHKVFLINISIKNIGTDDKLVPLRYIALITGFIVSVTFSGVCMMLVLIS